MVFSKKTRTRKKLCLVKQEKEGKQREMKSRQEIEKILYRLGKIYLLYFSTKEFSFSNVLHRFLRRLHYTMLEGNEIA